MITTSRSTTAISHQMRQSSKKKRDCLRSMLDGVKECLAPAEDDDNIASLRAELDSALDQLQDERRYVDKLIKEKKAAEDKHFKEIGKLVDEKMTAVMENTILRSHAETARQYYYEGAKELNLVINKLHRSHSELAEDHKTLQRKYVLAGREKKAYILQVEELSKAVQTAPTTSKEAEEEVAFHRDQALKYHYEIDSLVQEARERGRDAEALKERTKQMTAEITSLKARLWESDLAKERLVRDLKANEILLDALWSEVYDPTKKSLSLDQINQFHMEKEARDLIIDQLNFKLAVATPLPSDGCSPLELLIADLHSQMEQLTRQLSVSEEMVSGLNVELSNTKQSVSSLMAEKEVLVQELSRERELTTGLQAVEEMMKSRVEEMCAHAENLSIENKHLCSSLTTIVEEKQVLGMELISTQKEIAALLDECTIAAEVFLLHEEQEVELVEETEKLKMELAEQIKVSKATETRLVLESARKNVELSILKNQISNLEVAKAQQLEEQQAKLSGLEHDNGTLLNTVSELISSRAELEKALGEANSNVLGLKTQMKTLKRDLEHKEVKATAPHPLPQDDGSKSQPHHSVAKSIAPSSIHSAQATTSDPVNSLDPANRQEGSTRSKPTYPIPSFVPDRSYFGRSNSTRTAHAIANYRSDAVWLGGGSSRHTASAHSMVYPSAGSGSTQRRQPWNNGGPNNNAPYGH